MDDVRTEVSIVIPAFNEADCLNRLIADVTSTLESIGRSFELVLVDDGSKDNPRQIIHDASTEDSRIRLVALSRNFGKEAALAAGLDYASGSCLTLWTQTFITRCQSYVNSATSGKRVSTSSMHESVREAGRAG